MKYPLGTKLYYSISEVAEITQLQPHTLRAWDKAFSCLKPPRKGGKNRAYRKKDIGIVLLIKKLIYEDRFTTEGVKNKLKNDPQLVKAASEAFGQVDEVVIEKPPIPSSSPTQQNNNQTELLDMVRGEIQALLKIMS